MRFLRILFGFILSLFLIAGIFYLSRNNILSYIVDDKLESLEKTRNVKITIERKEFVGLKGLYLKNLKVKPLDGDTFLTADSVFIEIKLKQLLKGNIRPEEIFVSKANVNLIKTDSLSNINWLTSKNREQSTVSKRKEINIKESLDLYIDKFFSSSPVKSQFKDVNLSVRLQDYSIKVYLDSLFQEKGNFNFIAKLESQQISTNYKVVGNISPADQKLNAFVSSPTGEKVILPYLKYKYDALMAFDSVYVSLEYQSKSGESVSQGQVSFYNLQVNQPRLSTEDVMIKTGNADYKFLIGKNYIAVDSASTFKINSLSFSPFLKVTFSDTSISRIQAEVSENFESQDLFNSLPQGLFHNLQGIKSTGRLDYKFLLDIPFDNLDSIKLFSDMNKDNFRITSFGESDLTKMNRSFKHEIYDGERLVRVIPVDTNYYNYVRLNNISQYLKYCILTSEDGNFFTHRGFNSDALRDALITDIKEKRFARGGSTISMQLVKNVFLNRKKNIARKLEEIMIVWLIENLRLSSKEKMFEVYLNVIEWGPGIYGIKEASEYYFQKHPSALTLGESIFLVSIVPKPKAFKYSFDKEGNLRPYLRSYYNLLTSIMLRRQQITETDTIGLKPNVILTGPASKMLSPKIQVDTLLPESDVYMLK